jgi:hypothetical protein
VTASDRERQRLEKLTQLLRETHVTEADARREERTGQQAAYREELGLRPVKLERNPKFLLRRRPCVNQEPS